VLVVLAAGSVQTRGAVHRADLLLVGDPYLVAASFRDLRWRGCGRSVEVASTDPTHDDIVDLECRHG